MKKILYCVYGVFFTFIVWHVMFAAKGFDGAVNNSFDKGMDYPRQMAKIRELGLTFEGTPKQIIVGKAAELKLRITSHGENPVTGADVTMEVARPASREQVSVSPVIEQDAGLYATGLTVTGYGHWLVTAKIIMGDEKFTHEFRIYAEKEQLNET